MQLNSRTSILLNLLNHLDELIFSATRTA